MWERALSLATSYWLDARASVLLSLAYTPRHCQSAMTPQCPLVLLARLTVERLLSKWMRGGGLRPSLALPHTHGGCARGSTAREGAQGARREPKGWIRENSGARASPPPPVPAA